MSRHFHLPSLIGVLILTAGLVALGSTEVVAATSADAVTCPTVNPTTGAVTPAWANGVDWAGCDLTGADLEYAQLANASLAGANLTDADLQAADVSGTDLTGANLTGANLIGGVNVSGTILAGATLTGAHSGSLVGTPASLPASWTLVDGYLAGPGADLEYANLIDDDLTNVDLTGANLSNGELRDATLTGTVLAGADLSGVTSGSITGTPASLPADYTVTDGYLIGPGVDLAGSVWTNLDFSGADLENATLSGSILTDADLTNTDLTGADLSGVNLTGTELAGATLTGEQSGGVTGSPASLPANWTLLDGFLVGPGAVLTGVNFGAMDLSGYDLAGAQLGSAFLVDTNLSSANLAGADLDDATMNDANLAGAGLSDANLTDAGMAAVNLTSADLTGANLTDASIGSDTVSGARFTGATMFGLSGQHLSGTPAALPANWIFIGALLAGPGADLNYADLDSDNLAGADLSGASIQQASLQHTDLAGANLTGVTSFQSSDLSFADLDGANLTDASLSHGNFSYANLTQANLTGATTTGATLTGATWHDTICPDGSNSNSYDDGCFSSLDTTAPSAAPSVSHGTAGRNGWYTSEITVAWNWTDAGTIDSAKCQQTSTTSGSGRISLEATCEDLAGNIGQSSYAVKVDTTQPQVKLVGVRAGATYALGAAPSATCETVDAVSGVARPARLTATTAGKRGVGSFTATCAGAVSNAGTVQHAAVTVRYTVAYGFGGYSAPRSGSTIARRAAPLVAEFRLTASRKPISGTLGRHLASQHTVRVALSGPGIRAVTAICGWNQRIAEFTCSVALPRGIKTGRRYAYSLTVAENVGARFVTAPVTGRESNPELIYFR